MNIYKGENIIIQGAITDSSGTAVNFVDMTEVTATVCDSYKKSVSFTKTLGTVTAGDTATSYRFEITESQTLNDLDGVLTAFVKFEFTDVDYAIATADVKEIAIGNLRKTC